MLKGFGRKFPPLKILTDEQVEAIHQGALDLLSQTGVVMEHDRALQPFEKNDCKVDRESKRVRISPALVEDCIRRAPSSFRVRARDPKRDIVFDSSNLYFSTFPGMNTIDIDTWEPRVATRKENYDAVTVLDAMDNLHNICCYCAYFGFKGVIPAMAIPESVAAKIRNSTLTQITGYGANCERFVLDMALAIDIDIMQQMPISAPLVNYHDAIESAFLFVEAGMPMTISSSGILGGTYPATQAGGLVVALAEALSALVLIQLIRPGARVTAGTFTFPQNMRAGSPAFGAIGVGLHAAAHNQIWRKYNIPMWNYATGLSSSKRIDFQDGYEKSINAVISAISGASIMMLHGGVSSELTFHPFQAILDDDIAGMIGRFLEGIKVSEATLALDLIAEVGPIPGSYLATQHTREWWSQEQFVPKATDRLTYPEWMKTGKKSCLDYARGKMGEILAVHKVSIPLTESQEEDLERILREGREYYKKKGMVSDDELAAMKEDLSSPGYPYG